MYKKNIVLIIVFSFFIVSCGDTMSSVKRGLEGGKAKSTDEFLVEKKDPLILPPDFENLPTPDEQISKTSVKTSLEKTLNISLDENETTGESSSERSILEQIRKQ
jgi:hypothetical protein